MAISDQMIYVRNPVVKAPRTIRTIGAATALTLLLAGCGGENEVPADDGAPVAEPEGSEPAGDDEEARVNIAFDGEMVDFEEVHCGPSPGNDGLMRLLALFEGGELKIDADDDDISVRLERSGESDYMDREATGINFLDGVAEGEVEVSNADDEVIVLTLDVDCST